MPKPSSVSTVVAALQSGLGANKLAPSVQSLRVAFSSMRPKVPGEREFMRSVLPRLAYANPSLPIHVSYLTGKDASAAAPAEWGEDASSSSSTSDDKSEGKTPPKAVSTPQEAPTLTIEYGGTVPSRKIQLVSTSMEKSAALITRELLDLARFHEQGVKARDQASSPLDSPTKTRDSRSSASRQQSAGAQGDVPRAPEPTSTNLAGSAEGLSAGVTSQQ